MFEKNILYCQGTIFGSACWGRRHPESEYCPRHGGLPTRILRGCRTCGVKAMQYVWESQRQCQRCRERSRSEAAILLYLRVMNKQVTIKQLAQQRGVTYSRMWQIFKKGQWRYRQELEGKRYSLRAVEEQWMTLQRHQVLMST